MTLFERQSVPEVAAVRFSERLNDRRARTSWLAPPRTAPTLSEPPPGPVPSIGELSPLPDALVAEIGALEPYSPPMVRESPDLLQRLGESIGALSQLRTETLVASEEQLVLLAATIAKRVLARELSLDPAALGHIVREGIEALAAKDRITVRIGGQLDDEQMAALSEPLKNFSCEVFCDPALPEGKCIVETDWGQVDESIEGRLGTLVSELLALPRGAR